jgi:hypothetical protein
LNQNRIQCSSTCCTLTLFHENIVDKPQGPTCKFEHQPNESFTMPSTLSFTAPRMDLQQAADEYNSLSKEEKDLAWRDLYGKEKLNPDEETEEMISSRLSEMYDALQVIPERSKISYSRALQICPDYVNDRDFLVMFLRADCFDAKKAALRLVKYWNAKEDAFGSHRAFRKITLADMDEADFDTFRSGGYMPLPNRDKVRSSNCSCGVFADRFSGKLLRYVSVIFCDKKSRCALL